MRVSRWAPRSGASAAGTSRSPPTSATG
jgi:hypothetical protein